MGVRVRLWWVGVRAGLEVGEGGVGGSEGGRVGVRWGEVGVGVNQGQGHVGMGMSTHIWVGVQGEMWGGGGCGVGGVG